MLTTIEGMFRDGKIELPELPCDIREDTPVIVTFLRKNSIDLQKRGIDKAQAAVLRERLTTFAEDWETPEMSIYDNYDAARSDL
ncbi:MAG: hypothetical protein OXU79_10250 [Gemmatimonadota bacterium]|nr:hypothetical protein [Gemmatimonadota bacterium]